ncbi:nuclear transport factor 2 family protein [Streptomyces sp. NPDC047453]|uniref:nuclear transport factor 2 family protein n=1 Tax=Streptomyces sp. NPDC047453 TaxID=3154812 RepID=UPI003409624B
MTTSARDTLSEFMTRIGDPATARQAFELVAEDFVANEPGSLPYRGQHHGPRGLRGLLRQVNELFALSIESVRVTDAGPDRALADVGIRLASRTTGKQLGTRVLELYRVRDGKLVELDVFYQDTHALVALLDEGGR